MPIRSASQLRGNSDTLTGQFLISDARTPNRPELASEWNGQSLRAHAYDLWWQHSTSTVDAFYERKSFGDQFRADSGFIPQVGYAGNYLETGYTFHAAGDSGVCLETSADTSRFNILLTSGLVWIRLGDAN
jgi:hypothetical protein